MPGKGSRTNPLYEKQLSIGMFLVGFGLCIWGMLQLYGVIPDGKNRFLFIKMENNILRSIYKVY